MRVGVHQPNYFPWVGYFAKMAAVDAFVLLDNVEFQQDNAASVTNRTAIKTSQGPKRITVPVLKASPSHLIQDVRIDTKQRWQHKHLGSLTAAYGRAAAFEEVQALAAGVIGGAGESLAELNRASVEAMARFLGLTTPLILASALGLQASEKNERLIEICRKVGATAYLSGRGARRYNDEALFAKASIALEYTEFECPAYPQLHGGFLPNLSMLDAIFNCGPQARRLLGP